MNDIKLNIQANSNPNNTSNILSVNEFQELKKSIDEYYAIFIDVLTDMYLNEQIRMLFFEEDLPYHEKLAYHENISIKSYFNDNRSDILNVVASKLTTKPLQKIHTLIPLKFTSIYSSNKHNISRILKSKAKQHHFKININHNNITGIVTDSTYNKNSLYYQLNGYV